jgi:hypothetical protein
MDGSVPGTVIRPARLFGLFACVSLCASHAARAAQVTAAWSLYADLPFQTGATSNVGLTRD